MTQIRVEELARQVVADISADASYLMCIPWINDVYKEFVRKAHPSHLMEIGELNLLPYVTGGTVTTVRGSKIITGDSTAITAWIAGGGVNLVGWHFRTRTAWYEIEGIDLVGGTITLKSGFAEMDADDNNYMIIKRFYSLPQDVRWLNVMIHPRRRIPIEKTDRDMLDRLYTERLAVGTLIQFWCDQGNDSETGARRIEIYPPTKEYEMVIYTYSRLPNKLEPDDFIPQFIDSDALKDGVKVYALEHKAVKAADEGKVDIANFYLNASARQRTVWQGKLRSAILAESGGNVKSIILQVLKSRGGYGAGGDIATAREQVYAQWTPLT